MTQHVYNDGQTQAEIGDIVSCMAERGEGQVASIAPNGLSHVIYDPEGKRTADFRVSTLRFLRRGPRSQV